MKSAKGAIVTTDQLTSAQKASTLAAKAQSVALKAASTALNVAASIGIGLLINLGISLLQAGWEKLQEAFKSTDEKIKDLSQDLNTSLQNIQSISKEFQNLKSSADEIIPRFAELSNGVDNFGENISLTDEEYQEFLDLNNKIADMFPELNVGLDSNGNAMLALSGDADTLTESLYALLEVQRQVANQEIADGFNDAFENAKNLVGAYKNKKNEIYEKNESIKSNYAEAKELIEYLSSSRFAEEIAKEKEVSGDGGSPLERSIEGSYQAILQDKILPILKNANKESLFYDLTIKYGDGEGNIDYLGLINDNIFQDIITGFDKQIKDIEAKIQSSWNKLSSSISAVVENNPLYSTLDSQLKQVAKTISAGLDMSDFADKTPDEVKQYIERNILSPLNHIPIDAQEIISQIPSLQEQLKAGNISENEFLTQTTEAFNSLYESMDKDTAKNFSDAFVKGYNAMGIEGDGFNEVVQNLMSSWTDFTKAVTEATKTPKTFIDSLSEVEYLSNGLNKLAAIYQDIKDGESFDWSSILNNEDFAAQFEECGEAYSSFVETISNSITDIDVCQEAFDNLVTEYILGSGALGSVTEATQDATVSMLKQMGVVNAAEVVEKRLAAIRKKDEVLTKAQAQGSKVNYEALLKEAEGCGIAVQALLDLALKKIMCNDNKIDTKDDIDQIISLANAAGASAVALVKLQQAKLALSDVDEKKYNDGKALSESGAFKSGGGLKGNILYDDELVAKNAVAYYEEIKKAQDTLEEIQNGTFDFQIFDKNDPKFEFDGSDIEDGVDSAAESANTFSKTFNWIETAIEKVSKAASRFGNIVSNTFKSWTDRNSALKKQISEVNKEIDLQQKAYEVYTQKADSVGLSDYWTDKVRNGSIDISVITDDDLADKIDEFKEWYDKAQDCKEAVDELKESLSELYKTSFDNTIAKFSDILSEIDFNKSMLEEKISRSAQSSYVSFDKNQAALRKNIGYYERLIAQEKRNIAQLEKEKAELTAILRIGIQNGTIIEGTEEWAAMRDKINDVTLAVERANTSLLDYGESINEIYEKLFDNISKNFDHKLNEIQHLRSSYDIGINMLEAKGYLGSVNFYTALQDSQRESLGLLKQELASLQKAFAESGAEEYSDEWFEMRAKILDVNKAIREGELSLLEYAKALREIEWEHFDYLQERISDITTEADFLIDLLDGSTLYDDKGNFTDKGLAALGLHAQNYNVYMAQADKYYRELLSIEKELASDPYNTDLVKRKEELLELQQRSILAAEDEKQAMIDLAKSGIEAELNALKELIRAYTDALDSAKSLHDYQRKIADQTSEIASLEKQLLAYENDSSEEARVTKQKLQSGLDKAKDDLKETEYEKYISEQKELLDNLYADYEENMNRRLDNVDALLEDMIRTVNDNAGEISDTLSDTAREVGYELSDSMQIIWSNAAGTITDAVSLYGDNFSDELTTVNQALSQIETNTAAFIEAANNFASQSISEIKSEIGALSNAISGSQSGFTDNGSDSSVGSDTSVEPAPSASPAPAPNPAPVTNPPPEKEIEIGGKINAGNALIYDYAGAPVSEGERQVFANDPIYTVLGELNGFLKVRWHKLNSGVTGWFRKTDVTAYKNGGLANYTGLAQVDGTPSKPEYVLNPDETKNFLALNETLKHIDLEKLNASGILPKLEDFVNTNGMLSDIRTLQRAEFSSAMGDVNITIPIERVEDYNDFVNQLRNDRQFEKLVQAMTVDRAVGKSALAKNKFRW